MIWREFFGLDEESGLKDLRRAYSRKIKACRPEDDQEYFMEIRRRYEEGCAYFENEDKRPSFSMDDEDYGPDIDEDESVHEDKRDNSEERIEYDEEKIEYSEENTINAEIFDEGEERIEYDEGGRDPINPYDSCYEKLMLIYSDFNRRFNPESWEGLFFNLNFQEEDVFERVFEEFISENFVLSKEAVKIIRDRQFRFSAACEEMLDIVEQSSFTYRAYPEIPYDEREEFFKLRIRIYSWLLGYNERISEKRIERACHLAVRDDKTLRIFLYYMLQNKMDDLIEKCLGYVSEEDIVEKGFLAFSAQMDLEKGENVSSFEKYKRLMDANKKVLRYELGAFASGSALEYAGEEVEVPYISSECVFKIFGPKKKIEKMKSRGIKRSVKGGFLSTIVGILIGMAAFVLLTTGVIMLLLITFSPAERLESLGNFGIIVATVMRLIIAVGLVTGIGRWIRGKKRNKQNKSG